MSDLARLLQAHSATKLLHDPTRHVCNGCGQALTGTMSEHQADVLDLAGYELPVSAGWPTPDMQEELASNIADDRQAAHNHLVTLVLDWYEEPANFEDATGLAQFILESGWMPRWACRDYVMDRLRVARTTRESCHQRELEAERLVAHETGFKIGYAKGADHAFDKSWSIVNFFERLHVKTADRLRTARATIRDQRATITAQDALIDGMRSTLQQRRAMADTAAALS
jgi:hypothetical protein